MKKSLLATLLIISGTCIAAFSLFANHFGFDRDNSWGTGRQFILLLGLTIIIASSISMSWDFWVRVKGYAAYWWMTSCHAFVTLPVLKRTVSTASKVIDAIRAFPPFRWIQVTLIIPVKKSKVAAYFSGSNYRKANLAAFIIGIVVIIIYIWFVSVGQWINWPRTDEYYYDLATAFSQGQLNLLTQPDPELLALPDPYNYESRAHISHPWDVTLYKGKFYLYWGPAPALVLLFFRIFYRGIIGDHFLVFIFLSGSFISTTLFILQVYHRLFSDLSWKVIIPGVLLAGLANPIPWMLNRPGIYEAAIASGQFFLMTGVFIGFTAVHENGRWKTIALLLTSTCWALAIGSRVSLIGAVTCLLFLLIILYFLKDGNWRVSFFSSMMLVIPIVIGITAMGFYNKYRFDSFFELGHRYQLTGQNLNAIYDQVLSTANIPPNLHNYLLNPFRTLPIFPYVKPNWGGQYILFYIKPPPNYYSEQIVGALPSVPYLLFSLITVVYMLRMLWRYIRQFRNNRTMTHTLDNPFTITWLSVWLIGASIMAFSSILLYLVTTMRYLADMIFLATSASTLGVFLGFQFSADRKSWKNAFSLVVILLTTISIVVSLLLAVTGYEARFENMNPALFEYLTTLLTP